MADAQSAFHRAVQTLLTELVDGPPGGEAFVLNPGDVGLVRQLESIDAAAASARPMAGRKTVAAHADHVLYGILRYRKTARLKGDSLIPYTPAESDRLP